MTINKQNTTNYIDLGLIEYNSAWKYQEKLFDSIIQSKKEGKKSEHHLIFCVHPHVYTLGKSGSAENLLINTLELQKAEATFVKTNRGGDITYHGPGQIVGYPILDLEAFNLSIKEYVHHIEELIIRTLQHFDIKSERLDGATGVWIDTHIASKARKICAIGVKASRYVTMHGFAFNINTNLDYFSYINPCGFTDKAVTSLEKELGSTQNMEQVKSILLEEFRQLFSAEIHFDS